MSDPVLHIKDSYYFDVPKFLYPAAFTTREKFPEVWGQLDPEFQAWEFEKMIHSLTSIVGTIPGESELRHSWEHWQHADHANFAKPFDEYLREGRASHQAAFQAWKDKELAAGKDSQTLSRMSLADFLQDDAASVSVASPELKWFSIAMDDASKEQKWNDTLAKSAYWKAYVADENAPEWSRGKIDAYNSHLSGKILIPQVFGAKLRNLYEPDYTHSLAPAISKFMIIEFFVALIIILVFGWVGNLVRTGKPPKGAMWNLLEVFLLFIRDAVARPAIGADHSDHSHDRHSSAIDGPPHDHEETAGDGHRHAQSTHAHDTHHTSYALADRYVPLLWTIFMFILGCNLFGMLPWMGSPTGSWSVTLAMALTTFAAVVIAGVSQFGPVGFLFNLVPTMDIKGPLGWLIKGMIFVIEVVGLLIKHVVLSIRLLANMVAGHLVLLGIMGITFSTASAAYFTQPDTPGILYWISAVCSVSGSAALSIMEIFVAFLQAYVFTLLSALFIGSAVHKH